MTVPTEDLSEARTVYTELERLGGETWFSLGDKDLALHLHRTGRLAAWLVRPATPGHPARTFRARTRERIRTDHRVVQSAEQRPR